MSSLVRKHINFLTLLADSNISREQKKALLKTASKDQLKAIVESTYNILQLQFPISKAYKTRLVKKGRDLEGITDRNKKEIERYCFIKKKLNTITLILQASLPVIKTL